MIKNILILSLFTSLSFSSSLSLSPINSYKPLMSYKNYSNNEPMKLDYFNNNVNYPILPKKPSSTTYDNINNSRIMNTKTLPPNYFQYKN